MTSDHSHSDIPILRRIFATIHQRNNVSSTSNTTAASFHGRKSIIAHASVESRWIIVNGGASDGAELKEGSQIEEIEDAEDIPANDDDSQFEEIEGVEDIPENDDDIQIEKIEGAEDIPANDDHNPIHRTYQFDNCHVYMNSFNARGVMVKNSGNNAPRVTLLDHGGTLAAPNKRPQSSSKLSRPGTRPKGPRNPALPFGQSSHRHQDFPPDPTFESPPPLLFQQREDNSSYTSDNSHSAPPVWIDAPFPTFEQKQSIKRDKLPVTVDAKLMPSNPGPAPTTLPGPESQPHPINPFPQIHMGLRPNLLSHILQSFPNDAPNNNMANNWNDLRSSTDLQPHHYPETLNSSRHRPDTNSKSLEHHLDSALEILIQTSGILADGVTPQARNTLKAINALISTETPAYDPPPRFKSARKVAKWLRIPRSPK